MHAKLLYAPAGGTEYRLDTFKSPEQQEQDELDEQIDAYDADVLANLDTDEQGVHFGPELRNIPAQYRWMFRDSAAEDELNYRSLFNFRRRQELQLVIRYEHGGWRIESFMNRDSTFQAEKCVVCQHENPIGKVEKLKFRLLNCPHVVCEDCTHSLFYRHGLSQNDKRSHWVHWEAKDRGENRDQCPCCKRKLFRTLVMPFNCQRIETSAPIPVGYMYNFPVYSHSLGNAMIPFFEDLMETVVQIYAEVKEKTDSFLALQMRLESESCRFAPLIQKEMRALWELHDFLEARKDLFMFALTGRDLPRQMFDLNAPFYRVKLNRCKMLELLQKIHFPSLKVALIKAKGWNPIDFGWDTRDASHKHRLRHYWADYFADINNTALIEDESRVVPGTG